jgi:hypothetical protein
MARSSTASSVAAPERSSVIPIVVIVGQIDEMFAKIRSDLQGQSVEVAHVAEQELSRRLDKPPESTSLTPDVYLINCTTGGPHGDWRTLVKRLSTCEPNSHIVLALDKPAGQTVAAAVEAGAADVLWRAELPTFPIVWKRLRELLGRAQESLPPQRDEVVETQLPAATKDQQRAALARVEQRVAAGIPTAAERRAPLADVLGISVPDLRARSGRLDATKIADRLDVPIAKLAAAAGVTRQALSQTPDSPNFQSALDPMARALDVLDRVLSRGDQRKWLQTKHSRLGGATPIEAMLSGRAEAVARMLESVRDGGVD